MAVQQNPRIAATDRPAFTALVAGVLAVLVIAALLIRDHGDASRIVHAGPPWTNEATAPSSLTVVPADKAYDGQFFYRIGVSPFSTAREVSGVTFDLPALRNARWLSGALAWVLSGGQRDAVPWTLLLINLVAAIALGAVGGALARSSGRHAAWVCYSRCIPATPTRSPSTPRNCSPARLSSVVFTQVDAVAGPWQRA